MEFILTSSNELTTHEKRVLSGLCINKAFGAWVWKKDVLISMCKDDGSIIGWAAIIKQEKYNKEEEKQIAVYVKLKYRGIGIGKKLVSMVMDKIKNEKISCAPREEYPQGFSIFNKYKNIKICEYM